MRRLSVHHLDPQPRLVRDAVGVIRDGGLIAYPTDSSYAFGCALGNRQAARRIARIRGVDKNHNFTLICRDLSEIAMYARVENWMYRLLRAHTPGAYTFILRATRDVPRRLQNPKRRTIGIRVPDHDVVREVLTELGEPIMSSTLILPGSDVPLSDPDAVFAELHGQIDLLIDAGNCGIEPTTVVDLTGQAPNIVRFGKGEARAFS